MPSNRFSDIRSEMDGAFTAQSGPVMAQSAFFYYNPDPTSENRQHGHFSPHPKSIPQMAVTPEPGSICGSMNYGRPSSSSSQASYHARSGLTSQALLTPMASPQPLYQKPTILVQQDSPYLYPLDTECADMRFMPSTPPLSSSGSAISSPPSSCDLLPTPAAGTFFPADALEGVKQGCEEEVFSEILAGDWTRSASPPMTPGMFISFFLESAIGLLAIRVSITHEHLETTSIISLRFY